MPADVIERRRFVNRQNVVEHEVNDEGFGEPHGFALKSDGRGPENNLRVDEPRRNRADAKRK